MDAQPTLSRQLSEPSSQARRRRKTKICILSLMGYLAVYQASSAPLVVTFSSATLMHYRDEALKKVGHLKPVTVYDRARSVLFDVETRPVLQLSVIVPVVDFPEFKDRAFRDYMGMTKEYMRLNYQPPKGKKFLGRGILLDKSWTLETENLGAVHPEQGGCPQFEDIPQ